MMTIYDMIRLMRCGDNNCCHRLFSHPSMLTIAVVNMRVTIKR